MLPWRRSHVAPRRDDGAAQPVPAMGVPRVTRSRTASCRIHAQGVDRTSHLPRGQHPHVPQISWTAAAPKDSIRWLGHSIAVGRRHARHRHRAQRQVLVRPPGHPTRATAHIDSGRGKTWALENVVTIRTTGPSPAVHGEVHGHVHAWRRAARYISRKTTSTASLPGG